MFKAKIKTKIILDENLIHVEVQNHNIGANSEYAFYLYYYPNQKSDKEIISTTKYIKQNSYTFSIDKMGYYFVKCFVQSNRGRYNQDTNSILYLNNEFKKEFEKTILKDLKTQNTINEPIKFFKVPYPNKSFLLISYKNINKNKSIIENSYNKIKQWCDNYDFDIDILPKKFAWNTTNIIICDKEELKDKQYIFSGYAWKENKFYFGSKDVNCHEEVEKIHDTIGVFSLLDITSSSIIMSTDYYSYGKIYYFISDDILVAANSYHMLLIILSKLELKYELDKEFVYTIFASNVTLFRQPINQRMAIKNTFQMNLCDKLVINRKGWHFIRRESYHILKGDNYFNEQEYNSLIKKGAQEIISNVRAVLNHPNFNNYVLELSGGKDSRVTFAALTNIENANKKVYLFSTNHEPNDLDIAVGLCNLFNYKFYSKGDIWYQDDVLEYIKRKRSSFCGIRYLWYIESKHSYNLDKMVFNGECFESLAVRYYSYTMKNFYFDRHDYDELVDIYSILLSKQAIIDFNSIAQIVREQLLEGLYSMPSGTALEAFDNMYMFYRAGVTAGNLDRMYYTSATCMPLQSKALLKAKKMWINNFDEEKIIYDITYILNPVLASVPYNTLRYNETRKQVFNKLLFEDIRFKNCEITLNKDKNNWVLANEENKKNSKFIKTALWQDHGSISDLVYENCLLALQKLSMYDNGIFKESVCLPIYYYITQERDDDVEIRLIHNKLNSILDCIDAIEGKCG